MNSTNNRLDQLRQQLEGETIQEKKADVRELTIKDKEQISDARVDAKIDQRNQLRDDDIRRDKQRRDGKFYDEKRRDQQVRHEERISELNVAPSERQEVKPIELPGGTEKIEESTQTQELDQQRDLSKTAAETRRESSRDVLVDSSIRSHSDYYKFERAGVPQDGVALNPSTQRNLGDSAETMAPESSHSNVIDKRIDGIIAKQKTEIESERAKGPSLPPEASRKHGAEIEAKLNAREQSITLQKEAAQGTEQSQSGSIGKTVGPAQDSQRGAPAPFPPLEPQPQQPARSM